MDKKLIISIISLILVQTSGLKAQTSSFSFEYYQQLIFLRVKINQTDGLLFLFDTGANASAIDLKTADDLHLKTFKSDSIEGSAGTIFAPSVKANSLKIGKFSTKDVPLTKYDLSGSLAPPGQHLDGILGTDFLKRFVVNIDFQLRKFVLSKEIQNPKSDSISFEMENGIPRFKALLNGSQTVWFRYDSGASLFDTKDIYLNTTSDVLAQLTKADSTLKPVRHLTASGVGGKTELDVYMINSLKLNHLELKNPYIIVQPKQGYFARPDAVGFFSNNLLSKFQNITIDFIRGNFTFNR